MRRRVMCAVVLSIVFSSLAFAVMAQTAATWTTQADSLRGQNGQRFEFRCPSNGVISSRVWGTDLYTDDSSICSCAVHAGLITAGRGGIVTIQIDPGASSYRGSVRNGVTSADYGAFAGSFRFVGQAKEIGQTAQPIDWSAVAQPMRGQNDQTYRFSCPPNGRISARVWGTDLYTDDSSICTCAVHAGLITAASGGEVVIRIKPGASSYAGSTRNGVTTNSYPAYTGSYEFVGQGKPIVEAAVKAATWSTQADPMRGQNGQIYRFNCPPNGTLSTRVWGTDLYTDDSSICTCAVHAGLITTARGGEVAIRIKPGASSYAGSTRNGVTSSGYGAFSGSFEFASSGSGGSGGGQPPTGTRYRVENLIFRQPDANQNPRNYHDFMIDFATCSVYEMNQPMAEGREKIEVFVCRPNNRLTIKTTDLNTGYWVEYDWSFQENGRIIGGAWRDQGGWGPSVGGIYR